MLVLVGVNVYVFFFSPGSLKQVSQAAQAATRAAADEKPVPVPPSKASVRRKDGSIHEREGLGAALRREGLLLADANAVLRALQPIMDFKKELRAGQRYVLRLAGDGRLDGFELRAAPGLVYSVGWEDGKLVGKKVESAPKGERRQAVK